MKTFINMDFLATSPTGDTEAGVIKSQKQIAL